MSAILIKLNSLLTFPTPLSEFCLINLVKLYFVSFIIALFTWPLEPVYHSPKRAVVNCAPVDFIYLAVRIVRSSEKVDHPGIAQHASGFGKEKWQCATRREHGNTAYLKIQTLRLTTFMIRIASSGSFFSDSGEEVDSCSILIIGQNLSLAGGGLLVTAGKGT